MGSPGSPPKANRWRPSAAAAASATFFGGGVLFLKPVSQEVFFPFLRQHYPELLPRYRGLFGGRAFLRGDYPKRIAGRVRRIRARHGLSDAPVEYTSQLWEGDPQGNLFEPERKEPKSDTMHSYDPQNAACHLGRRNPCR